LKLLILIGLTGNQAAVADNLAADVLHDQQNKTEPFDREQALAHSQAAIGRQVNAAYAFTDTQGGPVQLSKFLGKPLVISLIYTRCFHICPTTTRELSYVVDKAREVLGDDSFNVVSIGFDTAHDTADAMRIFAKGQAVALRRWDFLSTDAATIDALSSDLGFLYTPLSSGFDHLIQASIIDAGGKVYRQVYGMRIATPHFVEPLKELVFGTAPAASLFEQLSDKIRLFCTVYDPASDRYRFDYSLLVGLVTGLFVGVLFLYWVAKEWRRYRHAHVRHAA
jgi:protein SCO1/2